MVVAVSSLLLRFALTLLFYNFLFFQHGFLLYLIFFLTRIFSNRFLSLFHLRMFLFAGQFDPQIQISRIANHNLTVKLDILDILADIHIGMPIDPIGMPFIVEAELLNADLADINLFDPELVIDDDRDSPSSALPIGEANHLLIPILAINHFLKPLAFEHITQKRQLPSLIIRHIDQSRHLASIKSSTLTRDIVAKLIDQHPTVDLIAGALCLGHAELGLVVAVVLERWD